MNENKIKRNKPLRLYDKRKNNPGRPNLKSISELTPEMNNFVHLVANGNDPRKAGELLGLSDYKVNTWIDLPLVKEEIKKWSLIYSQDEYEKWITIDNDLKFLAATELRKRLEQGKVSEKLLKELLDEKLIILRIKAPQTTLSIEERKKLTITDPDNNGNKNRSLPWNAKEMVFERSYKKEETTTNEEDSFIVTEEDAIKDAEYEEEEDNVDDEE